MKIMELIGAITLGAAAMAAGLYYFAWPQETATGIAWQGTVKEVQKQIAVEVPVIYSELVDEHRGAGKGSAMFTTRYTLQFGVDFPSGWNYQASKDDSGVVEIVVPPLSLLNEIKTEIDSWRDSICNKPTAKQLTLMQEKFKKNARNEFIRRKNEILLSDSNIYELSRRSLERGYLEFLNSVNKDNPARLVNVRFQNEPLRNKKVALRLDPK